MSRLSRITIAALDIAMKEADPLTERHGKRLREPSLLLGRELDLLAVAYKEIDEVPPDPTPDLLEHDLHFMGLVGMIDPPRPEAREAVSMCRQAGIKPVMITGDHVLTASAIAKDLGILLEGDDAVSGSELAQM